MFVSALAAGLLMFADTTPATAPEAPAAQTQTAAASAKPELKKVCTKVRATDSNMPRTVCKMVAVPTEEAANTTEKPTSPQ
jgi:hypothetical protein